MVKFDGISKHLQTKRNEILHFLTSFDNIWVYVHRTQIFLRRSECEISATFSIHISIMFSLQLLIGIRSCGSVLF